MILFNASTARLSASEPCAGLLGGLGTGRPSLGGAAAAPLPQPEHGGLGIFPHTRGGLPTLLLALFPRQAAATSHSMPMAELPPAGAVVWMKTSGKPARAVVLRLDVNKNFRGTLTLRFDDWQYQSRYGGLRELDVSAFWSALDHVEGA